MANIKTYMTSTLANWTEISSMEFEHFKALGDGHFVSESGSEYFHFEQVIYRKSDHWNAFVADCSWFIDGKTISRMVYGKCKLTDFKPLTLGHAKQLNLSPTSMAGFINKQTKREPSWLEQWII
jgi:hypothetical protein